MAFLRGPKHPSVNRMYVKGRKKLATSIQVTHLSLLLYGECHYFAECKRFVVDTFWFPPGKSNLCTHPQINAYSRGVVYTSNEGVGRNFGKSAFKSNSYNVQYMEPWTLWGHFGTLLYLICYMSASLHSTTYDQYAVVNKVSRKKRSPP